MKKEVLVRVNGVSKKFAKDLKKGLLYGIQDVIGSFLHIKKEPILRSDEFWAVQNISFELRRGECIGLIGHNGAGKSTLLKMLNGLITPDKGSIELNGRVGALIELGAGFNPILTGRENIYNNAAILGFTKQEIKTKFNEIVEFAEIEEYLDMPVKNYSSGMRVRLGFAIAAQLKPDILLVDEVLAVGDMSFVIKCFNKMDQLMENTALILVSHSMPQIARMSTQILILDKGRSYLKTSDVSKGILEFYSLNKSNVSDFKSNGDVILSSISLYTEKDGWCSNNNLIEIEEKEDLIIRFNFKTKIQIINLKIYLVLYDAEQRGFAEIMNFPIQSIDKMKDEFCFDAKFCGLPLSLGRYSLTIALSSEINGISVTHFRIQNCVQILVNSLYQGWTPIHFEPMWVLIN